MIPFPIFKSMFLLGFIQIVNKKINFAICNCKINVKNCTNVVNVICKNGLFLIVDSLHGTKI